VLTDNGIQFDDLPRNRQGPTARFRGHPFDRVCRANGIEHRLTKPNHPWTNGQIERMNRTIKEATVQRYYYDSHYQFQIHLLDSIAAYNFALRLKLSTDLLLTNTSANAGKTTLTDLLSIPTHQMPGLNA
jgi:transposase InsO family protein